MGTIESSNTIAGAYGQRRFAGTPSGGVNEVQTLSLGGTPTGGTFRLSFTGEVSGPISWSSTNSTLVSNIQTALRAMGTIGSAGVTVAVGTMTAGIGTVTVTYGGNLGKLSVPLLVVADNLLTGTSPTLAIAETTVGVTATHRGAPKGALLMDVTNGLLYENTGTALAPVWGLVGSQT